MVLGELDTMVSLYLTLHLNSIIWYHILWITNVLFPTGKKKEVIHTFII